VTNPPRRWFAPTAGSSLCHLKLSWYQFVINSFVYLSKCPTKNPRTLRWAGLEIVLISQAKTYPRTSFVRSSSPVVGLYFTIEPDEIALVPCNRMAAKLRQCFVVNDMVLMAVEVVSCI
jgi:hypothetical protein